MDTQITRTKVKLMAFAVVSSKGFWTPKVSEPITMLCLTCTLVVYLKDFTQSLFRCIIWIGRSKMNIRQIRNTIFTFAKPERQTISHSSGQWKHSRCSADLGSDSASHLQYRITVFLSSLVSFPLLSTP